mgnify:CR=1 FL=1
MKDPIYPIAIIGGGAAGVMAALRSVLNHDLCILFTGNKDDKRKSRATWVSKIDNIPGYHHYKFGITQPNVETIKWINQSPHKDFFVYKPNKGIRKIIKNENEVFELIDNTGEVFLAEHVIVCTGVMDIQPEISGSIEAIFPYANAQVADYCIRCDGHHTVGKDVTIIGNDNNAAQVAMILHERYKPSSVTIITHNGVAEFDQDIWELLDAYGIDVVNDKITEIKGDEALAQLNGYVLEKHGIIATDFTFISMGMITYNSLACELGAKIDDRGFVITNEFGETSISSLYVAGDIRAGVRKQIYSAWDSSVDSADRINFVRRQKMREEIKSSSKKLKKLVG